MHLRAPFILNGVCVRWRGWLDLERLDGVGSLEFDEESAVLEDAKLREQVYSNFISGHCTYEITAAQNKLRTCEGK